MRSFEREISLSWEYPKGILPYSRLHTTELCSHLSLSSYLVKVSEKSKVSYNQLVCWVQCVQFYVRKNWPRELFWRRFCIHCTKRRSSESLRPNHHKRHRGFPPESSPVLKSTSKSVFVDAHWYIYFDTVSICIIASPLTHISPSTVIYELQPYFISCFPLQFAYTFNNFPLLLNLSSSKQRGPQGKRKRGQRELGYGSFHEPTRQFFEVSSKNASLIRDKSTRMSLFSRVLCSSPFIPLLLFSVVWIEEGEGGEEEE